MLAVSSNSSLGKVLERLIYFQNLNSIEHLYDELGRRNAARRKRPTARQTLFQASQEESKSMPQACICRLIQGLLHQIDEESEGQPLDYYYVL